MGIGTEVKGPRFRLEDPKKTSFSNNSRLRGEWPARLDVDVIIRGKDGQTEETVPFEEYLKRIGNNNRGGT